MRHSRSSWFLAATILAAALLQETLLRADEPTATAAVHQALKKQVKIDYAGEPLKQVVKELQTKLGVPIFLDARALADAGIAKDVPVTFTIAKVSARAAIALMLRSLQLTTTVQHGVLVITTPEEAENRLDVRVYDAADLVVRDPHDEGSPDFDQLIDTITHCIHPTTWDDVGGPGSITPFESPGIKALVFSQTDEVHEDVEDFLATLRAIRDRKANIGKAAVSSAPDAARGGAAADQRLPKITEAEAAVRRALAKPISFRFVETPLGKFVATLRQKTGLKIVVDVAIPPRNHPALAPRPGRTPSTVTTRCRFRSTRPLPWKRRISRSNLLSTRCSSQWS